MAIALKLRYPRALAMSAATSILDDAPEIVITPVTDRKSWDALCDFAAEPRITQAWCHGEGKRADGCRIERLLFSDTDGIAALCQLVVKRRLGVPVTRVDRGPVFLRDDPSRELQLAVLRALRRQWQFGLRGLLLLTPSLPRDPASVALLREAGFWCRRDAGWTSSYLDLQVPLDELHRRLAPGWRTRIRRAQRLGVGLRLRRDAGGIEWLLDRHVDNTSAAGFAGPSPGFIRQMCATSPDDFWLLQAMVDGEPEAALLIGRFGQHAEIVVSWVSESARRTDAAHFLMWNAVIEMHRKGCRTLDLGGPPTHSPYGHFERGMRGREYQLAGEWLAF